MSTDFEWARRFELSGEEREAALSGASAVIGRWGLSMPSERPLVIHFGLGRFKEIGEIEYVVANDERKGYCGKFLFLFDGQRCPSHHHPIKDETFFIMKGMVEMTANGDTWTMRQGDAFKMMPDVEHTFMASGGPALVLEVSQPSIRNDNVFADKTIGAEGII